MKNKKTIGQRIKELREQKGLTQSQLGEKLFVSDKAISKWEKDKSEPDSNSLASLSKLFNVTLDYLITGNNTKEESGIVSKIELACRDDNIALLDEVDLSLFDDKGKNIDYYIEKYKPTNVRHFVLDKEIDDYVEKHIKNKKYYVCAIPKGLEGNDNLTLIAWNIPYEKITSICAQNEQEGYHHFKIFTTINVNDKIENDYQFFWAKVLDVNGKNKIVFSTAICDDKESGILEIDIFRSKTYKENKRINGHLVPDYYPESDSEYSGIFFIKPSVLKTFMNLLVELDVKNWDNKNWGIQLHELFFVLENPPKGDNLACHKFYVAPSKDIYDKFIKGIQRLFLDTVSSYAYRKFINNFNTHYSIFYREDLPLLTSEEVFKEIQNEMEEIQNKKFNY